MYYLFNKPLVLYALSCMFCPNGLVHATSVSSDGDYPCPMPQEIAPCRCRYNQGQSTLNLDCSDVEDGEQLYHALQANFPVSAFNNFTIDSNDFITEIKNHTFDKVSFEEVWISFSALETIEVNAFAGLESCLKRLYLYRNKISKFPFYMLHNFTVLEELSLLFNEITHIPVIRSETLSYLELGMNPIHDIPLNPFTHLPNLRRFAMESNGLAELYPGLFVFNPKLEFISLWGNQLRELEPYWLSFPEAHSMGTIILNHNSIDVVEPDTFYGLNHTNIYIEYNRLTKLEESAWRPVLQSNNTIHLKGNHLTCSCDVAWLVLDQPLLDQLDQAKCDDGRFLADLDPSIFDDCNTTTTISSLGQI